ncbi:MAG: hypothetical protein ACLUB3_13995 [Clostridium sp.]
MYVPLEKGALKLLLYLQVFFTILAAASYIFHLMLRAKGPSADLLFNRINGILERMHQSEETIAHQQRLQIMGTMTGGIAMNLITC